MHNTPKVKPITDFGTNGQHLTFQGQPLEIQTMGAPIAQFEYGDKYLLILPDDPYANALFFLVLLNNKFRAIEHHSAPDNQMEAVLPKIEATSENTVHIDWGLQGKWNLELLPVPKYMPMEAYRRATAGWLPLFEYPLFIRRGYLKVRRAD